MKKLYIVYPRSGIGEQPRTLIVCAKNAEDAKQRHGMHYVHQLTARCIGNALYTVKYGPIGEII